MNGLYGYPTPGGMGHVGYLGLAGTDPAQEATVMSVLNGNAYESIKAGIEQNRAQFKRLDALEASISSMPSGAAKSQAIEAHRQAVSNATAAFGKLAQARGVYNDLATKIRGNTPFSPGLLSGLGFEPATSTMVLVVLGIAGAAILINQLAGLLGAWRGNANATEGYISQGARLVQAGGGAMHEAGETMVKFGQTSISLAYAALIGVGAWALFKYLKSRQSGSSSSASPIPAVPTGAVSAGAGI